MHVETPTAPEEFTGTIQNISDDAITQTGTKAISFINWSMPENENETAIDYFEITLMGTHTNSTMSICMADQSEQKLMLSFKYVLSEGNYTAASITAVDLCGQRSTPTQLNLTSMTKIDIGTSNMDTSDSNSSVALGAGLGVPLGVIIITAIALSVALIILGLIILRRRNQDSAAVLYHISGHDE